MSRVTYTFDSPNQLGWTDAVTCDWCGKKVTRSGPMPKSSTEHVRREFGNDENGVPLLQSWWVLENTLFSRILGPGPFLADMCRECGTVLADKLMDLGLKPGKRLEIKLKDPPDAAWRQIHISAPENMHGAAEWREGDE